MANDDRDGIGYGRPPKNTQFKKGESGNPRGRPKKRPSFTEDLRAEFAEKIDITQNGVRKRVTKQRAIVKQIVAAAAKSDLAALKLLMPVIRFLDTNADVMTSEPIDVGDVELVEKFLRQHNQKRATKKSKDIKDS